MISSAHFGKFRIFAWSFVAVLFLAAFFFSFPNESLTGFAVSSQKTGTHFSISVSGSTNYELRFDNLKNETISNVVANVTFPAAANVSNYGIGSLHNISNSLVLSWIIGNISENLNTTLNFASDVDPTQALISGTAFDGSGISESMEILQTTTTVSVTTTTAANATLPEEVSKKKRNFASVKKLYKSDLQKKRAGGKPEEWFVRKGLDKTDDDDVTPDWDILSQQEKLNNTASLVYDLNIDKSLGASKVYSKVMSVAEPAYLELSFFYKPKFSESEHRMNIGVEIIDPNSGDINTIMIGMNGKEAFSSGEDFEVNTTSEAKGWKFVNATTNEKISVSDIRIFIDGIPYTDDTTSSAYFNEISVRLLA